MTGVELDREKNRRYSRRHYYKHKVKRLENARSWEKRNPLKRAKQQFKAKLKLNYGMSLSTYTKLLALQGNACAICGRRPKRRRLDVDHDHKTRVVRGLLCGNCNLGLGLFADKPTLLRQALTYLEATNG